MEILGLLSLLTIIVLVVGTGLLIINQLYENQQLRDLLEYGVGFLQKNAYVLGLVVAAVSTAGSLYFSEFQRIPPCSLCWYQRIFMYPNVIILLIAQLKNDSSIIIYLLTLNGIGGIIAAYHTTITYLGIESVTCRVGDISCINTDFQYLGFITIPLMSLIAFVVICYLLLLRNQDLRK